MAQPLYGTHEMRMYKYIFNMVKHQHTAPSLENLGTKCIWFHPLCDLLFFSQTLSSLHSVADKEL